MSTILLKSNDYIGKRMAGTAIRYFEFAKNLSKNHRVILATPNQPDLKIEEVEVIPYYQNDLRFARLIPRADVVVSQHFSLFLLRILKLLKKPTVIDLSCPILIENLEQSAGKRIIQRLNEYKNDLKFIKTQLKYGDFFLCANEEQRNFWIGLLCAQGRLNPVIYDRDPSLSQLLAVLPYGLPGEEPRHTQKCLKGVYPNIKETDKVIIWNGGLWEWLDPLTPIEALAEISKKRDDIKLIFMGIARPNARGKTTRICQQAMDLSKELGIYNQTVFFKEGWVDYAQRQNLLLEADIGIITHLDSLETKYSFRTRILDCIWTKLPIITTTGGSMSNLVETEMLGITCQYNQKEEVGKAILKLVEDREFYQSCKLNLTRLEPQFRWKNLIKPLDNFCQNPKLAADKISLAKKIALLFRTNQKGG